LKAALEITRFIFVDNSGTGQFVEHCTYFGEERFGGNFVVGVSQSFDGAARCFVVITIAQTANLRLADPFE
jgi:hypothetical protein